MLFWYIRSIDSVYELDPRGCIRNITRFWGNVGISGFILPLDRVHALIKQWGIAVIG